MKLWPKAICDGSTVEDAIRRTTKAEWVKYDADLKIWEFKTYGDRLQIFGEFTGARPVCPESIRIN